MEDEYDPFAPNDYEVVLRDRVTARQEEERLADLRQRFDDHRQHAAGAAIGSGAEDSASPGHSGREGGGGAAAPKPAPPASSARMSILPAWMTKAQQQQQQQQPPQQTTGGEATVEAAPSAAAATAAVSAAAPPPAPPRGAAVSQFDGGGGGIGARMMAKMGHVAGKGLGKDESGITAPLLHMKTGVRSGVIRAGDAPTAPVRGSSSGGDGGGPGRDTAATTNGGVLLSTVGGTQPADAAAVLTPTTPTHVVLLRNMAGPGDVDDDLEAEVKEECATKYGPVEGVFVFECGPGSVPEHEAVRIFVRFASVASAARAQADLHGRFFGGRAVSAAFFDEGRYARFEFAP